MNKKLYSQLSFFQTLVSLIRDLVIIVAVIITVIIVYFGGEPSSLSALDWAKLIGSAFIIVIGPLIIYFIFKKGFEFFNEEKYIIEYVYIQLKILYRKKHIKRQDVSVMLKGGKTSQEFLHKYPEKAMIIAKFLNRIKKSQMIASKTGPYFYALITLALVIFMFIKIFSKYIP